MDRRASLLVVITVVSACTTSSGEFPPSDFDTFHNELHTHSELNGDPLSKEPVVVKQVAPVYPRETLVDCKRGWVFMEFTIDEEGHPEDIEIVTQDSYELFGSQARYALSQWRFEPAERDGRRVKRRTTLPMVFPMPRGCPGSR